MFADAAFTQPKERIAWFKIARSLLKRGQADVLIKQMQTLSTNISGERRTIINSHASVFHQLPSTQSVELFPSGSDEDAYWQRRN